jgi:hypothetical protein
MIRYKIGIDPDVKKSGYAVWDNQEKKIITATCLPFFDLLNEVALLGESGEIHVTIEAGWLNAKSNFHGGKTDFIRQRIAKNVGSNHQIGKLFEEYCIGRDINYTLYKPINKKTDKAYFKCITGLSIKNQDVIDAVMLVFGT